MEAKGLEYSEYVTKESLAQQGGYGLTNKGPQHDEAWLIFMDQVNNQFAHLRGQSRSVALFPDVADLVRAGRVLQTAVERRGAPQERQE